MRTTDLAIEAPQWAFLIPVVLVIPFVTILLFAVYLNRGR